MRLLLTSTYSCNTCGISIFIDCPSFFAVSVAKYSQDDWQKLRAAVNALKNPVLDDTVHLESTKFGYIHSTSNEHDLAEDEVQALRNESTSFGYLPVPQDHHMAGYSNDDRHARRRRGSEGGILTHHVTEPVETNGGSCYGANSNNLTSDWVAGLPVYGRRARSHTDPVMPLDSLLSQRPCSSSHSKAKTLPGGLPLEESQSQDIGNASGEGSEPRGGGLAGKAEATRTDMPSQSSSPPHASTSQRTPSLSSPSVTSDTRPSSGLQSPVTSMTSSSKLVKIYMSRVQKGTFSSHWKVGGVLGVFRAPT